MIPPDFAPLPFCACGLLCRIESGRALPLQAYRADFTAPAALALWNRIVANSPQTAEKWLAQAADEPDKTPQSAVGFALACLATAELDAVCSQTPGQSGSWGQGADPGQGRPEHALHFAWTEHAGEQFALAFDNLSKLCLAFGGCVHDIRGAGAWQTSAPAKFGPDLDPMDWHGAWPEEIRQALSQKAQLAQNAPPGPARGPKTL